MRRDQRVETREKVRALKWTKPWTTTKNIDKSTGVHTSDQTINSAMAPNSVVAANASRTTVPNFFDQKKTRPDRQHPSPVRPTQIGFRAISDSVRSIEGRPPLDTAQTIRTVLRFGALIQNTHLKALKCTWRYPFRGRGAISESVQSIDGRCRQTVI